MASSRSIDQRNFSSDYDTLLDLVKSRASVRKLTFRTAGGGGWGDPRERDRGEVARDVAAGYVSAEAARRDYGGAPAPANATE